VANRRISLNHRLKEGLLSTEIKKSRPMAQADNPIILVPARMAATRLPGKPLMEIGGLPMIVRVWRQAELAGIGPVVIAAGDPEIAAAVTAAGGRAVLTDSEISSGSDRVHAALQEIDPDQKHNIVVNLQGDIPAISPDSLRHVVDALTQSGADIATLVAPADPLDRDNPNVVKPVIAWASGDKLGRALYFSRACVPSGKGELFHHIGIYAYTRDALTRFVGLPISRLEKRERLEQLRAIEAGMNIVVARVDEIPLTVDTEADIEKARRLLS
jgi:3-deoxy-manno-octulosonate cytidylyltransferase (CMP-KDO synthetase)